MKPSGAMSSFITKNPQIFSGVYNMEQYQFHTHTIKNKKNIYSVAPSGVSLVSSWNVRNANRHFRLELYSTNVKGTLIKVLISGARNTASPIINCLINREFVRPGPPSLRLGDSICLSEYLTGFFANCCYVASVADALTFFYKLSEPISWHLRVNACGISTQLLHNRFMNLSWKKNCMELLTLKQLD